MESNIFNELIDDSIQIIKENGGSIKKSDFFEKLISTKKQAAPKIEYDHLLDCLLQFELVYAIMNDKNVLERITLTKAGRYFKSVADEQKKWDESQKVKKLDITLKELTVKGYKSQQIISFSALGIAFCSLLISILTFSRKSEAASKDLGNLQKNREQIEQIYIRDTTPDSIKRIK